MKNGIGFIVFGLIGLVLMLLLNGTITIPGKPLPALGQFLNPNQGIWNNARHDYNNLVLRGAGLGADATIGYDERYVPHIFANNIDDALFLQGYVEASNRLFQMDFISRAASSRIAEVVGVKALPVDIAARKKDMEFAADIAVASWQKSPKIVASLQRYIDGVNYHIDRLEEADYPIEYKLLGFKPEKWTIKKTALVYKYMADILCGANNDLENTNLINLLGQDTFDQLYPVRDENTKFIIPTASNTAIKDSLVPRAVSQQNVDKALPKVNFPNPVEGIGSNNWVVSGEKSKTGSPILCSDPHLLLNLPSVWIEEQIITPDFNSYGVSFPGVPGILIGFNEHIAWAETNVGIDVKDHYLIKWENDIRGTKYLIDSLYKEAAINVKEIKIKNHASYYDTTYMTDFGRIKYFSADAKEDIASHWIVSEPTERPDMLSFVYLMQSKNVDEFDANLINFTSPAQNFLFADNSGNIAIRVNGKLPARAKDDGIFIEYGTSKSNKWTSTIPFEDLPQAKNPAQGYLTSSNQLSTDASYPYFYYMNRPDHFRNLVINDLLTEKEKFSVKDMRTLQGNSVSYKARNTVPSILKYASKEHSDLVKLLEGWDYSFDKTEVAPAIYNSLFNAIQALTFDEISSLQEKYDVMLPPSYILTNLIKDQPNHVIFDINATPEKETLKDIVNLAFKKIKDDANLKSIDLTRTSWAQSRKVNINHLTQLPAFSALDLEADGSPDAINALSGGHGPSWRMVVHLKDKVEAWGVYPGGQSGDPASKYYRNFIDKWVRKEHYKLYFVKDQAEMTDNLVQIIQFKA